MDIYNQSPINTTADGVKIFTEQDFYWGILDRDEMQSFINLAWEEGYAKAIEKTKFTNRKFNSYTSKYDRADFHFLLPIQKDASILDLGSGYGNITIPLARHYKKVIAADASLELLQFSKCRAVSEGLDNIDYIKIDALENLNLPFIEKSFDVVILSGILEWVGPGRLDKKPDELQKDLLMYLRKLLKDDGFLYIAIENRLFPGWITRDPHSKLKWTSILPRSMANIIAKRHGHKDGYRTYIYSMLGYIKMLKKTGFQDVKFYFPFTTYRLPKFICSDANIISKYLFVKNYAKNFFTHKWFLLFKTFYTFGVYRFFAASFMMIASKNNLASDWSISSLLRILVNNYDKISINDHLMKIDAQDDERAHFLLFRDGGVAEPYAEVMVCRNKILLSENIEVEFLS